MTLVGEAEIRHQIGTPFNDPGATSTDIVDGDLPVYSSEVFSKNKLLHQGFIINARLDSHQNLVNGGGLLRETPSEQLFLLQVPAVVALPTTMMETFAMLVLELAATTIIKIYGRVFSRRVSMVHMNLALPPRTTVQPSG